MFILNLFIHNRTQILAIKDFSIFFGFVGHDCWLMSTPASSLSNDFAFLVVKILDAIFLRVQTKLEELLKFKKQIWTPPSNAEF